VTGRRLSWRLPRALPVASLWVLASLALSAITGRVTDWFVMTDELLYERLAIGMARTLSPLPRLNGVRVPVRDELYPLLVAPFFRHGPVPHDLHLAHLVDAWIMSSACIPVYVLGRRVTGRRWAALLAGFLTVCVPWIMYSSFLLTEVVAYPAFAWAVLGLENALARPSARNDALALLGLGVAFFSRTQLAVLVPVLPLGLVLFELGRRRGVRWLRAHRVLVTAYVVLAGGLIVLWAEGHLGVVLGTYRGTAGSGLLPTDTGRSALQHVSELALGLGILPVVVGLGWLGAGLVDRSGSDDRHAFACIGAVTVVLLAIEATIFDLRLGVGLIVYDRYLFYLAPVVFLATLCAVTDPRRPRLTVAVTGAGALVAAGFALDALPGFEWSESPTLDPDAPVAGLYRPLVHLFGDLGALRAGLALVTIVLTALFVAAARLLRPGYLACATVAFILGTVPLATVYDFHRLFGANDFARRPLTGGGNGTGALGWVDQTLGAGAKVAMIPYSVSTDYFVNLNYWRDLEFWNTSVVRDVEYPSLSQYAFTGNTFPKILPTFDLATGSADVSPTAYVVQSVTESRFRLAGNVQVQNEQAMLIDATMPWRLSWISFGLADDGWMRPHVAARIRVFGSIGQRAARIHYLYLQIWAPGGVASRAFEVRTNVTDDRGHASDGSTSFVNRLPVCVPASGHSDVRITAQGSSSIPADLGGPPPSEGATRLGSIFLADTSVSDDLGPRCSVSTRPGGGAPRKR
jgi:Dolichyl-phosphate-mannose-protein mannosyltransferase